MQTQVKLKDASYDTLAVPYQELVKTFVSELGFPSLGAKTALAKDQIDVVVADSIFSTHCDEGILKGLYEFIRDFKHDRSILRSLVVVFKDYDTMNDEDFEMALWTKLQSLHDKDIYPWDTAVTEDEKEKSFRFSAGKKSFHIVGMHPGSSNQRRRFPFPAMVFNLQEQFARLPG